MKFKLNEDILEAMLFFKVTAICEYVTKFPLILKIILSFIAFVTVFYVFKFYALLIFVLFLLLSIDKFKNKTIHFFLLNLYTVVFLAIIWFGVFLIVLQNIWGFVPEGILYLIAAGVMYFIINLFGLAWEWGYLLLVLYPILEILPTIVLFFISYIKIVRAFKVYDEGKKSKTLINIILIYFPLIIILPIGLFLTWIAHFKS